MKYMRFIHPSHLLAVRTSDARDQDAGVFGLVILGVTRVLRPALTYNVFLTNYFMTSVLQTLFVFIEKWT